MWVLKKPKHRPKEAPLEVLLLLAEPFPSDDVEQDSRLTAEVLESFTRAFLLPRYDESTYEVPEFHKDIWELCCSDRTRVAIAAPRTHAKSTAVTFAYILACVLFRERKHVLVLSSTEDMASDFVSDIKTELLENERLTAFFKFRRLLKDSESEVIGQFQDGSKSKNSRQRLWAEDAWY